jgi:hypothetical protein
MTQLLIESGQDLTVQNANLVAIESAVGLVSCDPAPMVIVQNNQPQVSVYLHGPPGIKGDTGEQGDTGSVGLLDDVQFSLPLLDRQVLQYRTGPSKWINSSTLDGGNM